MTSSSTTRLFGALALAAGAAHAQSSSSSTCSSSSLSAKYPAPSVAPGYVAKLVANNLDSPRGIVFDSEGALLVVEQDKGVTAITFDDCLVATQVKTVVDEPSLNHGIQLSPDGKTLYASSGDTLWSWDYSAASQTNTSAPRPLVTGMAGSDHTSRTLLLSGKVPGMMVINRGSNSNIDPEASDISTGHSQIKAFSLNNLTSSDQPYDFNTAGRILGWGLRNDVGIAEEPITGGVYSVENGADQLDRLGVDIHLNNPAEKMNFLGYLNGTYSSNQGRNFGYPSCFAAWNVSEIPQFSGTTGVQFAIGNSSIDDNSCSLAHYQSPRLSFQAHMAPLDILFNPNGTAAWITFHGSWNRNPPVGYKLSVVDFANGEPVAANDSRSAARDIVSNADITACPGSCFRPVGLAWDAKGRLFMSSDASGEIYVVLRSDGNATDSASGPSAANSTGSTTTTPAASSTTASPTGTGGAGVVSASVFAVLLAIVAFIV